MGGGPQARDHPSQNAVAGDELVLQRGADVHHNQGSAAKGEIHVNAPADLLDSLLGVDRKVMEKADVWPRDRVPKQCWNIPRAALLQKS